MRPVQLMIIGAEKSGTSSLKNYLGQHPGILTHKQQEMTYFVNDSEYQRGYTHAFRRYFHRVHAEKSILLAKSAGIMYLPEAMKRVKALNAETHVVIVLRNPLDRAYSAYWYARRRGWEYLKTFEEGIQADPKRFGDNWVKQRGCAYLDRSMYAKHLSNVLEHFSKEQVHVFLLEDIERNAFEECRRLYNLFDLDSELSPHIDRRLNVAALPRSEKFAQLMSSNLFIKRSFRHFFPDRISDLIKRIIIRLNKKKFSLPPMNPETRTQLIEYFKPHNAQLNQLLERDLSHWDAV